MKVGLLTFHDTNNFGSLLQTYGLYKQVNDLGYECEVIDYQCENIVKREVPNSFHFTLSPHALLHDFFVLRHQRLKYKALSQFVHSKIVLSDRCDRNTVADISEQYDTLLIGSDIVWGLDITGDDLTYLLDFASNRNCRKISFAASIGNAWNEDEKKIVAPLLIQFNYIAVREKESAEWVKEASGKVASVVCDPTMLLTPEVWKKMVGLKAYRNKNYILVYFMKGDCLQSAIEYSKKTGMDVFVVGYGVSRSRDYRFVHPHSLCDFLSLVYNASVVFTASYHGFLFSAYFNRPFVYFNISHPSRMATIAKKLGVEHLDATYQMPKEIEYDYELVNHNLEEYRQQSISELKKMLGHERNM